MRATRCGPWSTRPTGSISPRAATRGRSICGTWPQARKCVASGAYDRTARIWEVASGKEIRRLAGYADQVVKVAFTPDGRLLFSVGNDGTMRMTYVRLQDAVDFLCSRQLRDFLPDERDRYNITDTGP